MAAPSARVGVDFESGELTHAQKQIWIGQRLDPASPLYNMAFAFLFPARLEADRFALAWRRVSDRSDVLRTRILERDGEVRRGLAAGGRPTEVLDFTKRSDPELEFRGWCRERCARPLPLAGDLVDSVLVKLGEQRYGWYLNQHHLITDAWSTLLLFGRVGAEYEALAAADGAAPSGLPAPPPYYPTVSALASRAVGRRAASEHWAMRGSRPGRSVPLYGTSGKAVGTASTRYTLEIDEDRSRALDELARQDGFKSLSGEISRFGLFATLLVSWLHRVGEARDLGFDAPVAGRPTSEAKRALGLFIEMFPFAVNVLPRDTFRSLGARCLEESMRFLRHALPGLSTPAATTAGNVVLNYFPSAFGAFAGLPVEVEWLHSGHGDGVHALRLQVHDFAGAGRYTLHFDGNQGALSERFWCRGLGHFEKLLDACLADPDRQIAAVDVLLEDERRSLVALNSTGARPLPDRTVIEMFEAQADREPDRVALRQGSSELSFADLRQRSEALAATLVERGLEPEDRVVIPSRRSMDAVIAILATLRAGCAYVPVEASLPRRRLAHVVRDSGARLLLLEQDSEISPTGLEIARVAVAEGIRASAGRELDRPRPDLGALAYLIYTSGSTGRAKGVLVEHRGLSDYLIWAKRTYVRGDRLTFPLFTSMAFDLTVTSLFLPLITGGTLEIYPRPEGPVDSALLDVAAANSVDFIKLTPSHLSLLARVGLEDSRVRRMVVGGENLPTHLAAAVGQQLQDRVELYNEYGPTEAVVGCVAHRFEPRADTDSSVPIGRPADHVEVEILDEALSPVPEGTPGELWISRYGLARGYEGLTGLTAERFRPRPGATGERRYRSGDRVRLAGPGKLEYLGRLDRQVKVSGHRVEPAEVEAALLSVPGVEQCAVVARRRPAADREISGRIDHCVRCGLPSNYPRADFDEEGLCRVCRSYEAIKEEAEAYFKTPGELRRLFAESARRHGSEHDCMMLFSGGKDSTYALCRLVEMGLAVYAFTLDNGFISDKAKENIRKVARQLGVPVEFATTPAMNAIFRDSLRRFSNVCNGCFKTIYTLSMKRARELGIPIIVTGLSRGQMFETRLSEEMFRGGRRSPEEVDAAVLAARKVYHRADDEVSRSLDVTLFQDDRIFDEIRFVDFYRYVDVGLDEVYSHLRRKVPWVRPEDTGRSTNCLINDVGIYVHKQERGFHNYALPYSWDVRLGHKDRATALDELDDEIDPASVSEKLAEIGYQEAGRAFEIDPITLHGFYVGADELPESEVRRELGERLPAHLVPSHLRRVDSIPLTTSGKIDDQALAAEAAGKPAPASYRAPAGPVAEYLADLWRGELGVERVGADDSFFELGGTSLAAMEVMIRLCREFSIDLPLETLFARPTLGSLARVAEERILADVVEPRDFEPERSPAAGGGFDRDSEAAG